MRFNRTQLTVLTAIGALALAGCAGPSSQPQQDQAQQDQTQQQSQAPSESPESGTQETAEQNESTDPANEQADSDGNTESDVPVFTTKEISYDGTDMSVEISEIDDDGTLATVNLKVTNKGDKKVQLASVFSDGDHTGPGKGSAGGADWLNSLRGITLTDTKNKKIHRVAYDSSGRCLCDMSLHMKHLEPEEHTTLSASFASIPDGQETATVTIPNVGSLKNVPINR